MVSAKPKVLLTGGGTGGHITPLIAIAQALAGKAEVSVVVEHGDLRSRQAFEDLQLPVYEVRAGKLRRYHGRTRWYFFHPTNVRENIRDSSRVVRGFSSSWRLLRQLKPDVVFVKGGYGALPVGLAAASQGIAMVTHDSDVLPGLTNRILSRWAKVIAVGFPREYYRHYPARKLVHVGIPVRPEFIKPSPHKKGSPHTILIVGGTLGARTVNQIVLAVGKHLIEQSRIIHVTGKHGFSDIKDLTREWQAGGRYKVFDYVGKELFKFVAEADIAITRAGATYMAEFAVSGVPMIVIPSPFLTGGHQLQNAQALEQASAAVILGEPQLRAEPMLLVETVRELLGDAKKRQWLARNAKSLFPADATERLASIILETARSRGQ